MSKKIKKEITMGITLQNPATFIPLSSLNKCSFIFIFQCLHNTTLANNTENTIG